MIAVSGWQEGYAYAELIDGASRALADSAGVRIRLEAGRSVVIAGRTLHRVLPVLASTAEVEAAQANSEHEPIAGEIAEVRGAKLDSYRRSVVQPPAALGLLLQDVAGLAGKGRPSNANVNGVHQRLLALAMENQGPTWAAANVPPSNPLLDPVDYLKTAGRLIGVIVMSYAGSREPESAMQDLLITMRNGCQAATQRLLGAFSEPTWKRHPQDAAQEVGSDVGAARRRCAAAWRPHRSQRGVRRRAWRVAVISLRTLCGWR